MGFINTTKKFLLTYSEYSMADKRDQYFQFMIDLHNLAYDWKDLSVASKHKTLVFKYEFSIEDEAFLHLKLKYPSEIFDYFLMEKKLKN